MYLTAALLQLKLKSVIYEIVVSVTFLEEASSNANAIFIINKLKL